MSLTLTRMFAYFTIVAYLVVGTVAVRLISADSDKLSFDTTYFSVFQRAVIPQEKLELALLENHLFEDLKIEDFEEPVRKQVIIAKNKINAPELKVEEAKVGFPKIERNELPFYEPVTLSKIVMNEVLMSNHMALYVAAPTEPVQMIAESPAQHTSDEVTTKLAAMEETEAEPEFFEYPQDAEIAAASSQESSTKSVEAEKSTVRSTPVEIVEKAVDNSPEEISLDQMIAFDYSQAAKDIKAHKAPVVSKVTTQPKVNLPKSEPVTTQVSSDNYKSAPGAPSFSSQVTIQVAGTDLKKNSTLSGFEVRFNDDQSEILEDYNAGEVQLKAKLSTPSMIRSTTVLKRGFIPTTTDLIVEKGVNVLTIPLVEEETFNKQIAPFEAKGPVGAVLVELDDESETAELDVPHGKVIHLDGNLRKTNRNDYRYRLFVGVQAGNALLSYKHVNGKVVSKIIHIHEREVSFEANYFEPVVNKNVALYEEDLLSREKSALITSAESVKVFATNLSSEKINDHTYRIPQENTLLGGRRYLELSHQAEPVFVGHKEKSALVIPSENFMRHILSQFEGKKLGNRCLVQVNLSRRVSAVEVGSESVSNSLAVYTQMLDADGKFYDSVSEKTKKIIIIGESQGSVEYSQDAKINIKVTYDDDSVQFLGSYCSPNTYLVEQL